METFEKKDLLQMEPQFNLLVMGIPNVGKSTVINRLRNVYYNKAGKATKTGAIAGVTRAVLERVKICDQPRKIYLFDTPGILEPASQRQDDDSVDESFFRCAAVGSMSDDVIGPELIADYILYWFNKNQNYRYMTFLGMESPSDNIVEALTYGAIRLNKFKQVQDFNGEKQTLPNLKEVAEVFLRTFRTGKLGPVLLDIDHLD